MAFNDAVDAWRQAARPVLERAAREYHSFLTYEQLADAVQEDSGITTGMPFRNWIGRVLEAVDTEPRAADEPMLSAMVVRADGTIGPGYAHAVELREGSVPEDLDMHAAVERLACYRYFGATIPVGGGAAKLPPQVAAKRRGTGPIAIVRPTCPTCFVQLPATGRCDACDG